jgi:hypothetical protein
MRTLSTIACALLIFAVTTPAFAYRPCGGGRCATVHRVVPPVGHWRRHAHRGGCCCRAPAGWGWYLRQKFYHDCSAPLAVVDELGDVTLVRER